MSLVIEYLSVGGLRPDLAGLEAWKRELSFFQDPVDQDGVRTWWYRNPSTGVYFSVSYRHQDPMGGDQWAPCGLEALVNHLRPDYFAREAGPVLAGIARDFGLVPRDADTGRILSMDPDPEQILSIWLEGNRLVREETLDQGRRLHMVPLQTNLKWWEYSRRRPRIEEALRREAPGIAVPEVHFLHSRPLDRLQMAFSWENEGATVFPPADLVILDRTEKKFLGFKKERKLAYVAQDALMRQIVGALKTIEVDGYPVRVLTRENAWRAAERLPMLPLNEDLDVFQNVLPSRIVDADS
ncbi:MAG: hypothetical protein H6686_01440 [Fibrobacteria bacterium]|nr:hypothetical protein [Fibrobacteria bacterium]